MRPINSWRHELPLASFLLELSVLIELWHECWRSRGENQAVFEYFIPPLPPSQAVKLLRQISQWEERQAVLFMLELTWERDKTLLYGSAIPFMYNI